MTSLQEITEVAKRLGPLRERVVFLGGAATGLLITDRATLVAEVAAASQPVKEFIAAELRGNLVSEMFLEAVAGHMLPGAISQ